MASSPNGTDGNYTSSGAGITNYQQFDVALGNSGISHLEVGKSYTVNVSSTNLLGASLNVGVPAGYEVIINGVRRKSISLSYGSAVISVLPRGDGPPGAAGFASSVSASSVDWRVSLGGLLNGSDAGSLRLVDSGVMSDDWSPLATPAALNYEAVSEEVFVYREDNIINQIIANQVAIDVVPNPNGTEYEIKCYNPAQGTGTAPTTFEGEPFAVYRVTLGSTATSIKFTKETREITNLSATGVPIARTEVMSLKREGAWPNFKWTKDDWMLSGTEQAPLARTVVKGNLAPVISLHPAGKAATAGSTVTLAVAASGVPVPSYQWTKNGNAITGATLPTLTLTNFQSADLGTYSVIVTNALGSVTSGNAALSVYTPPGGNWGPVITAHPQSQTALQNGSLSLAVTAVGNPAPTYQWYKGGAAVAGANGSALPFMALNAADAASYTVSVAGAQGTVTSAPATLTVSATRSEAVEVSASGTSPVLVLTRNYAIGTAGEGLAAQQLGSTNSAATSFDYYTNPAQSGNWGFAKSVTLPGGGWEAFDYYDSPTSAPPRIGQVMRRYRPFGSAPTSPTQTAALGEVTLFEYGPDAFGYLSRPTLVRTTVNATVVAQTTTTYANTGSPYPNVQLVVATQADLVDGSTVLTSVRQTYAENTYDAFIRGQLYSQKSPDGTLISRAYDRGTWNGAAFTPANPTATGPGTGTASRISTFSNQTATALIDGKSTKEDSIRDERALLVRIANSVWKNSAWQLVGWTNFTYNLAGLLTQRVSSNGATYSATYLGLQKVSETDETGATTTYTYDAAGRVSVATRAGSGGIAAVATRYTYDAVGHVLMQEVGWGGAEQLVSTKTYDDAGRLVSEASPGVAATTHTYNVGARSHTTTFPSAATRIETAGLDGRPVSVEGTAVVAEYRTYGFDTATGRRWEQVNLGAANSPRWRKTWKDRLGREVLIQRPVFPSQPAYTEENVYNDTAGQSSTGHLVKNKKTGTNATLYVYDSLGRVMRSGLDANSSGALESLSTDRLSESDTMLESFNGAWWWRTETRGYAQVSSATPMITSMSRQRLTGFTGDLQAETQTTDILGNVSTQKREVFRATATVKSTTTTVGVPLPGVTTTVHGLTTAVTGRDELVTTFGYDALRRRTTVVGPRNSNTTATTYQTGTGLVDSVRVLNAASVALSTTTYTYDPSGRQTAVKDPGEFESFTSYTARGQVHRQWGAAALPVEYDYDASYGERTVMRTYRTGTGWSGTSWPASPGTADATTWAYDPGTGLLTSKTDAANRAVAYSYFSTGQLARRTWARGVTTDYYYDSITAEQRNIESSDGTPTLHYTYNRLGQVSRIDDGTGFRTQTHCLCGKLATEQLDPTFFGGRLVTYALETATTGVRGRSLGYTLKAGATVEQQTTYAYDTASRLSTLATQTPAAGAPRTFRYGYLADSDLLNRLTIDDNTAFAVNRSFEDKRDVLTAIETVWGSAVRARYDYVTNGLGQRTSALQSGDAFADNGPATYQAFGYDGRGQLTAAPTYLGTAADDSQKLDGRQYFFEFDNIGNRTSDNRAKNNPEALRNTYTTNALNQYTAKTNKSLAASGTTQDDPALNVAVQAGGKTVKADRLGRIWNAELSALDSNGLNASGLNTNGPWRDLVTVYTGKAGSPATVQTSVRLAQIAALNQAFAYDLDGNLIFDGVWNYAWDAENRLIRQTTAAGAVAAGVRNIALEYRYDYLGRRVQKLVIDAAANRLISGRRFLYNGWNLLAEYSLNASLSTLTLVRSYTWGLDIARTLSEAGGVGAVLQIADHPSGKTYFPAYDGNGNVTALVNSSTGTVAAAYEYSPFGEQLRADAPDSVVADQPFRFSTKYTDSETGLVYYGRRYYEPKQGRFVGRDPIEEQGGINLYGFCGNNGVNRWDVLGMLAGYDLITGTDGTFTVRIYNETDAGRDYSGERYFTSLDAANSWGTRATANAQIDLSVFSSGPGFDTGFEDFEQMGAAAQQTLQTQALSDINRELAAGNSVAVTVGGQTFILTPGGGAISGGALGGVIIGQIVNLGVVDIAPSGTSSTVQRLSAEESAEQERLRIAANQPGFSAGYAAIIGDLQKLSGPLNTMATINIAVARGSAAAITAPILVGAAPAAAIVATNVGNAARVGYMMAMVAAGTPAGQKALENAQNFLVTYSGMNSGKLSPNTLDRWAARAVKEVEARVKDPSR